MASRVITIHQPEHIPWLGFFNKISKADVCVLLDNVQFRKNYFQNRNRIRTVQGSSWVTVPSNYSSGTLIKDVTIANDSRWKKKWWDTILMAYSKSRYAETYLDRFRMEIDKDWTNLSSLNISLINIINKFLDINVQFVLASELQVEGKGSDLILNICKKLDTNIYISGISGKDYLKPDDFKKENINIEFQIFNHPIYKQLYEPFIPCMSAIDLLCNYGSDSLNIINGINTQVMNRIFK